MRGGDKNWSWVKKGVPLRLEIGPRDMAAGTVFVARRDQPPSEKESIPRDKFVASAPALLDEIQEALLNRARRMRELHTKLIDTRDDFYAFFATPAGANSDDADGERQPFHGGFALTHWSGDPEIEPKIKADLGVTLRCIPLQDEHGPGTCPFTGKPSKQRVIWAKSY
jgi:prolyl-tRNA synthetase